MKRKAEVNINISIFNFQLWIALELENYKILS